MVQPGQVVHSTSGIAFRIIGVHDDAYTLPN